MTTTTTIVTNAVPAYDTTDNPTNCCPRFKPEGWDGQELHFKNKPFVKASTVSLFHVPLNMGSVFARTWGAIRNAHAENGGFMVLSHDDSAWHAEHLFAVSKPVEGAEIVNLSGDFLTKVFEGPFANARMWRDEMKRYVEQRGRALDTLYFFYTTCPKCAKEYGKNYVVAIAKVK
jgi:hydrolase family protein